jgi:hypothetical protein
VRTRASLINELKDYQDSATYKILAELLSLEEDERLDRLRHAETVADVHRLQGALEALESIQNAMQIPR